MKRTEFIAVYFIIEEKAWSVSIVIDSTKSITDIDYELVGYNWHNNLYNRLTEV